MNDQTVPENVLNAVWSPTPLSEVDRIALDCFGIAGRAVTLSSERDETFLFRAEDAKRYVIKIANPAERLEVLEFQTAALLHLASHAAAIPIPRVVNALAGPPVCRLPFPGGSHRLVRMLTFLDGEQLHKAPSSPLQTRRLGMVLAELGLGLAGFRSPVPDMVLLWDLTHVLELRGLLAQVDPEWRHLVAAAFDNYERLRTRLADLPAQVIHNDFNPHNILVAKDDPDAVAGIIDFGDMVSAPLVNDLAIALSYVVGKPGGAAQAETFLTGYNGVRKLTPLELIVLPALIRARLAMTVTITEWRAATRPDNRDYILRNHPVALAGLKLLADVPDAALASKFRTALGEN